MRVSSIFIYWLNQGNNTVIGKGLPLSDFMERVETDYQQWLITKQSKTFPPKYQDKKIEISYFVITK
jgi:hypothetical protein